MRWIPAVFARGSRVSGRARSRALAWLIVLGLAIGAGRATAGQVARWPAADAPRPVSVADPIDPDGGSVAAPGRAGGALSHPAAETDPAIGARDGGAPVVRVRSGTVHLLMRNGRRVPMPAVMALRPGDELVTSPSVQGSIQIEGQTVALAPLSRYRMGVAGVEFARAGEEFAPLVLPSARRPLPVASLASGGVAIVQAGSVRRRGEGWSAWETLAGQSALFPGDVLAMDGSGRALLRVSGGTVELRGPAHLGLSGGGISLDSGTMLIRGRIPVVLESLGLRLRPAQVFTVEARRAFARVVVLAGVGRVEMTDGASGGPLDDGRTDGRRLAPGQEVTFTPDRPLQVRTIAIARVLAGWGPVPAGAPGAALAASGRAVTGAFRAVPGGGAAGRIGAIEGAPPAPGAQGGGAPSSEPRQHARPIPLEGPATMPLRDRILAMESPANRLYFFRKRDRIEAHQAVEAASDARSEPERLALHKARRAAARSDQAMSQLERDKDDTFERGVLVPDLRRDATIGPELASIYGVPGWLLARQEIGQFRDLETARKADVEAQTAQIQALRAGGASAGQIASLEQLRAATISSVQAENDRLATFIRIEDEPPP